MNKRLENKIYEILLEQNRGRIAVSQSLEMIDEAMCEADAHSLLGEVADMETAGEPITNALYATGRFTTEQCEQLMDGILQYIDDYGLILVKKS
jgi:hypothetical protein